MAPLLIAFILAFGVADLTTAQTIAVPTPAAPASAPAASQPAPAASSDYRVGPQDTLSITVFGEPQLSGKVRVDNDGSFPFQYLGRVKVDGMTVTEIEALLRKSLADGYLRNPQISVEVDQYRSQSVFVLGEVRLPNKYSLAGNSTLMDALTQAGSVSSNAGHWILIRHARQGVSEQLNASDENTADLRINLDDLQSGKIAPVPIQDGDTIYVPRAERIYVNGQVRTPGAYPYEENMTVFTAIALAGGITEKGSNTRISVVRIEKNEKKEIDVKQTDTLRAGDQVFVKPRRL